jgi:hypothetical protein
MEETYPFSNADKVEIISYPVRRNWDMVDNTITAPVIDKKIAVKASGIKDRVVVNEEVKQKLFNLLYSKHDGECSAAACYNPRHCVLFYKGDEIIAYIELCLGCGTYETSNGVKIEELCHERMKDLRHIFEEAGVKYFGDGEED